MGFYTHRRGIVLKINANCLLVNFLLGFVKCDNYRIVGCVLFNVLSRHVVISRIDFQLFRIRNSQAFFSVAGLASVKISFKWGATWGQYEANEGDFLNNKIW